MGHVIRDKQKLRNRVRRIRGQVEAIERALDGEAGCAQIISAWNYEQSRVIKTHVRP
jgi:DNA-binding FrmR family transcriptional regulator